MKKVKHFMSRRVLYLKPDDTIFKAAKSFCRRGISGAPVVSSAQSKRVIGVVSESDIVKFMGTKICNTQSMAGDFTYQSLSLLLLHFVRTGKDYLGFKKELKVASSMVGSLLVRSIDTAQRVNIAMEGRGFNGNWHSLSRLRVRGADIIFLFLAAAFTVGLFIFVRPILG